jgi:myo-inositol-hexaphosphate 3-phosphohydrolase
VVKREGWTLADVSFGAGTKSDDDYIVVAHRKSHEESRMIVLTKDGQVKAYLKSGKSPKEFEKGKFQSTEWEEK